MRSAQGPALLQGASSPEERFRTNIEARHRSGRLWRVVFFAAITIGLIALGALLYNISNEAFGLVAVQDTIDPSHPVVPPAERAPQGRAGGHP